jgi:hypothetical protein
MWVWCRYNGKPLPISGASKTRGDYLAQEDHATISHHAIFNASECCILWQQVTNKNTFNQS